MQAAGNEDVFLQLGALNAHALLSGSTLPAARSWPRNLELHSGQLLARADLREKTQLTLVDTS